MKAIKYSLIGMALIAAGLTSCQDSYDAPALNDPKAELVPNTTLLEMKEFIQSFSGTLENSAVMVPQKDNGDHYIIHGRVISCDASGNIYQSLVIQDETTALNLSIREANMWSYYREGQDVVIDATGLYAGLYNGLPQLGWLDEYNGAASMTFMSWFMFREHNQLNGLPNDNYQYLPIESEWPSANPYCLTVKNIGEITAYSGGSIPLMSQLVEIQNVSFQDAGVETFAPYHESVNRTIVDSYGNSMTVRTSGYSNFYNQLLPEGTGTVRGILSYYRGWQILLRDIDDVMFGDMPGDTQETAVDVNDAIGMDNTGRQLWVKGYVVGSVKGGVNKVTSNDDIIFGADAQFPYNVVIAQSVNETNYQNCMVVELGNNTAIRKAVNLVDNPDVYGKLLYVKGGLNEYLGLSGITGADKDFYYEGLGSGNGGGIGNEASPYSVDYFITNQPAEECWVEGYIVGFVNGTDFYTGSQFNADAANMTDYNNINVIISSAAAGATTFNSIPVRTSDRNAQGLKANPSNLGKKVKIFGTPATYLNAYGLSPTSTWKFE